MERETWTQLTKETSRRRNCCQNLEANSWWLEETEPASWNFTTSDERATPNPGGDVQDHYWGKKCGEAALQVTVSLVPSSDCFWKIKSNENYTVFTNSDTGCMLGTPESQWRRLQDGSYFMRANPWESKRDPCDQELLDMFELKTYKNEVWLHADDFKEIDLRSDLKNEQDPEAPVQHDKTLQVGQNALQRQHHQNGE